MNTPANSLKHIVPAQCRKLNPFYFHDDKGVGYDFIILFGIKKPEDIFGPRIQVGQFHSTPQNQLLIALKKDDDGAVNHITKSSLSYLRIDEFELIRDCLSHCNDYEELRRRSTFNPVAATVYGWMKIVRYELRMFDPRVDFFNSLKQEMMNADLEVLYKEAWITY